MGIAGKIKQCYSPFYSGITQIDIKTLNIDLRNMGIAGKIKQCYFHPFILTQIDIKTLNLTS